MKQWHGGKGSVRRNSNDETYAENWEKIFGKETPSHGASQVHSDKTKYNRKNNTID